MNLDALPKEVLQEVLLLEEQRQRLETRDLAQEDFMAYVQHVYEALLLAGTIKSFLKNLSA